MNRILLLAFFFVFFASSVVCVSDADPHYIYNCNAVADVWGCDPAYWIGGNRLNCSNTSRLMNWATKPSRSNCYTIVAGEESNPVTRYTPDEYVKIHIRVHCLKQLYRGILIYAVNSSEQKVGEWDIPVADPPFFSKPWRNYPDSEPCKRTVMHATAEWKPLHSVLYFRAPPGTGTVTFRCLIKYGNANTGDFYWPATDISLNEGPVDTISTHWFRSNVGQSCNSFCAQIYGTCNETALQSITTKNSIDQKILPYTVCEQPHMSGCGPYGGSYNPDEGVCYFIQPNCAAQNRTPSAVTCATSVANFARNCPCNLPVGVTTNAVPTSGSSSSSSSSTGSGSTSSSSTGSTTVTSTGSTSLNEGSSEENSAGSRNPGLLAILLVIPYLFSLDHPRYVFAMLIVLGMVSGHNWLNSLSRSPGASTYRPCKPPLTAMPHAQVGPGQFFEIEWMLGHGDYTYFAVVHSDDADYLKEHSIDLLEDYIANAPVGNNVAQDPLRQKFHRKEDNSTTNTRVGYFNIPNFFAGEVKYNDPRYLGPRPAAFGGQIGALDTPAEVLAGPIYQMAYNYTQIANDRIVSYSNANYPWIEAVYKFQVVTLHPNRPDVARFYIPGRSGPGRYIVHWMWRGYRDCVDVDLKTANVSNVYGVPANVSLWTRIDHCFFDDPLNVFAISETYTDAKYCTEACSSNGNCYGVNFVPLMAPSSVYQGFTESPGDAWMYPQYYGSDLYVPWNHSRFNSSRDQFIAKASPNNYLCYGVRPKAFTDTEDEYIVVSDPQHPHFYSTCYYRFDGNVFPEYLNSTSSPEVKVPWRYFESCIDCQTKSYNAIPEAAPRWTIASRCIDCGIEPANVTSLYPAPILIEGGVRCDGMSNVWRNTSHHNCTGGSEINCVKQLVPIARGNGSDVTFDECRAMAASDPSCSDVFFHKQNSPFKCYCYTNQTCCKVCSRTVDVNFNTYEVNTAADPTCSTGVLSSDSSACCSKECGAGGCTTAPGNGSKAYVGFCCSNCSSRPCSQYGPPCTM